MREFLYIFFIELKAVGEFEKDWVDNRDKLDKRLKASLRRGTMNS